MDAKRMAFGIREDGSYLVPPDTPAQKFTDYALQQHGIDEELKAFLKERSRRKNITEFGPIPPVNPSDLTQAGWGLIIPHDINPEIIQALKPLLDFRREQAKDLYKELIIYGPKTAAEFFTDNGIAPGPVDPSKGVPYYLLIVADPERIPFEFQYQLEVQFAVGRLHFDGPEEEALPRYRRYAQTIVSQPKRQRRASVFAVRNTGDFATILSSTSLCPPIHNVFATQGSWQSDLIGTGTDANGEPPTPERLKQVLKSDKPSVLFTASHGINYDNGHAKQLTQQGALVCQGWKASTAVKQEHLFTGADVPDDADIAGMLGFTFACFSSGTPKMDDFAQYVQGQPSPQIAPRPFIAALPQALLGHPNGGAAAIVGHVERAWASSFIWNGNVSTTVFEVLAHQLTQGISIGHAMDSFGLRYAEMSTWLTNTIHQFQLYGQPLDPDAMSQNWTANNDARNYIILGDPAATLRFEANSDET
ncbi:MAG: hypothetical protein AAFV53_03570 [Myxococcota bacterium]